MEMGKFQKALEIIESLTEEEKESLMQIVRNRIIEQRRDRLAESIREAKKEYECGEIKRGSVDELMSEIPE